MESSSLLDNLLGCEDLTLAPGASAPVPGHDGGRVAVGDPGLRPLAPGAVQVMVSPRHGLGEAGGQGPLAGLAH